MARRVVGVPQSQRSEHVSMLHRQPRAIPIHLPHVVAGCVPSLAGTWGESRCLHGTPEARAVSVLVVAVESYQLRL